MNKHPKTIKQLNQRLHYEYIEIFPYGKHKGKRVEAVVTKDPNYIVWWADTIIDFRIDPKLVDTAWEHYKHLSANPWRGTHSHFEHWGEEPQWEDMDMYPESVLGDPWDPKSPF